MSLSPEALGAWLLSRASTTSLAEELSLYRYLEEKALNGTAAADRDLPFGTDPHRLDQSGWGVVWTESDEQRLRPLLQPLLARRKKQAGARYLEMVFAGRRESAAVLLARHGETLGTLRPEQVPYYLLILGEPEEVPFEVQYHLGINHAVGRLAFRLDADYRAYADHVCAAERGEVEAKRTIGIFSVENDPATRLFGERLINPLVEVLEGYRDDWDLVQHRRQDATLANLKQMFSPLPPSLLIISSHGRGLCAGSDDQENRQGAILCEPEDTAQESAEDHELRGDHLLSETALCGQICFLFSCYAAGTPVLDSYPFKAQGQEKSFDAAQHILAKRPFVASLPQSLLRQGALGVIGHVDRSWSQSFAWAEFYKEGQEQTIIELDALATIEDSLNMLLQGERLGHALRSIHRRQ